jgi:hypothetical protein
MTANIHIMSSPLMMNLRKTWLSKVTKYSAYFHAALSRCAGHFTLLHEQGDPAEVSLRRIEAIRIVNERLCALDLGIGNGTIGAVSCMLNYEASHNHNKVECEGWPKRRRSPQTGIMWQLKRIYKV